MSSSVLGPGYLKIDNGQFGAYQIDRPNDAKVLDYSGQWIAPGLVDTHIHGLKGFDIMDNNFEGLQAMSEGLLSCGVTSFLPTTLTADHNLLTKVCTMIGERHTEVKGAKIKGIYFEGPFFTEQHKGAQNPKYFTDPSVDEFDRWQDAAHGLIKKIAIAPERADVIPFIKAMVQRDVVVALGHSDATYDQACLSVLAGASVFVHTFNGMSGLSHHAPGMVGAALTLNDVYDELICDGHHVLPPAIKILLATRGYQQTVLVTDCMRAGAMPDGEYSLGEFNATVKDGAARLANGSLAGSVLQLKDAMKNLVDWNLATPEQAIRMATEIPAKSCHIESSSGYIRDGRDADFIVLNPNLELIATYLSGVERYSKL